MERQDHDLNIPASYSGNQGSSFWPDTDSPDWCLSRFHLHSNAGTVPYNRPLLLLYRLQFIIQSSYQSTLT